MARKPSMTPHKQRFVDAWFECGGDELEAVRRAGYKGSDKTLRERARRLLKDQLVLAAIAERTEERREAGEDVASDDELLAFWTRMVRQEPALQHVYSQRLRKVVKEKVSPSLKESLTASKLLGTAKGMFVHIVEDRTGARVEVVELPDNQRGDRLEPEGET